MHRIMQGFCKPSRRKETGSIQKDRKGGDDHTFRPVPQLLQSISEGQLTNSHLSYLNNEIIFNSPKDLQITGAS